jgi:hypothetical protein
MACSVNVLLRGHPEDESPQRGPVPDARWGFSLRQRKRIPQLYSMAK